MEKYRNQEAGEEVVTGAAVLCVGDRSVWPLKRSISLSGKSGNPSSRHDPMLTPRVPLGNQAS